MSKTVSLLLNQILQKTVVEIALLSVKQVVLLGWRQTLGALVEFDVFPDLFEQLQHLITCFHAHISEEDWFDEVVREIEGLGLGCQEYESLGVLFVALAALEEQNEVLECAFGYGIVVLHEELHGLAEKHGVLLFYTNLDNQSDKRGVHLVLRLKLAQMCDHLFKVLLLRLQDERLQQALVPVVSEWHLFLCEDVAVEHVFCVFADAVFLGGEG